MTSPILNYKVQTDLELLILLKKGDRAAFTEIYDRYWESMADHATRLTKSREEAADIVQEIFVSIWNRKSLLEEQVPIAPYLMRSTRNLSLRFIRDNIHRHHFLKRLSEAASEVRASAGDLLQLKQLQGRIDEIVETLPTKMKEVYQLSRKEQLSHKEIARRLGISETTVKKQINNALKIITSSLGRDFIAVFSFIFMHLVKKV
jgi:RNA polymerase sigma-70 factor (ECF subfamily)